MRGNVILDRLSFSYPKGFSLKIDRLEMKQGELTVILGPNGSGKSTLFSLLRGRLKAQKGTVLMDGKDMGKVSDRERAALVGLVPQLNRLPFGFTVEEVVKMGAYRRNDFFGENGAKVTPTEALEEVLRQTDLLPFRKREADSLSGGEYQRVLLARVLLQDPQVLLLDEPANHLDLRHQERLLSQLRQQAQKGKTVVAILHDINQALLYGDRVILLNEGRCFKTGEAEDVVTPENIRQVYQTPLAFYYPSEKEGRPILGPEKSPTGRRIDSSDGRD
ncbi:MAG: ABC transporter ATP-binding protein [Spirochaetales bacterium]|nr:ABC transporter ATP-binding protein [Spirochaetales bacterium]